MNGESVGYTHSPKEHAHPCAKSARAGGERRNTLNKATRSGRRSLGFAEFALPWTRICRADINEIFPTAPPNYVLSLHMETRRSHDKT